MPLLMWHREMTPKCVKGSPSSSQKHKTAGLKQL